MKTKNIKLFGLFCLLMLSVVGAQAQSWNYPNVEKGNTIVSRDAMGGVKSEALLTSEQKTFLMNQITQPIYNENSDYNRVSAKFEVASTDASMSNATWADAYSLCKSYSTGATAGSWRLPTQRELMLMWMLKSQLTACGNITSASGNFWSSTEHKSYVGGAWYVTFSRGDASGNSQNSTYTVRCVRDL